MTTTTSTILCTDAEYAALDDIVGAHHGRVVHGTGQGLLAAFDSATDAVDAAVDIEQQLRGDELGFRVGIGVGDIAWDDGDCIGRPVVVADHLRAVAAPGHILVSALVRLLAGDGAGHRFRPLEPILLGDADDSVDVFDVEWSSPQPSPAMATFDLPLPWVVGLATDSPFVGRDDEWQALVDEWRLVTAPGRAGRSTVFIAGEAGSGKTRLALEFARWAGARDAAVAYGACDPALALPYQPFVHALDHLVRAMPDAVLRRQGDSLGDLAVLLPQLERRLPGLRRAATADPDTERYRVFSAVQELLEALDRPIVLVIDDLHWAGPPTLALLRHLARSPSAAPLLVVATFRDTVAEVPVALTVVLAELRRADLARRLTLAPLDLGAVERFVTIAVGHPLDDGLRRLAGVLAERGDGNPFYLGELWRHVVTTGGVAEVGGRWHVCQVDGVDRVPEGVREVELARLAGLSTHARDVAELVAMAGSRIDARVLRVASHLDGDDLGEAVGDLVDAGVLIEVDGVPPHLEFAHAIVRETIAGTMRAGATARLHHRLAEATEAVYAADRRPVLAEDSPLRARMQASLSVDGWTTTDAPPASSPPAGLSAREVEVLRLVASGCTNRQIGHRLIISSNTAANHVRAILRKTHSANRAEATAYAARHGLLE